MGPCDVLQDPEGGFRAGIPDKLSADEETVSAGGLVYQIAGAN